MPSGKPASPRTSRTRAASAPRPAQARGRRPGCGGPCVSARYMVRPSGRRPGRCRRRSRRRSARRVPSGAIRHSTPRGSFSARSSVHSHRAPSGPILPSLQATSRHARVGVGPERHGRTVAGRAGRRLRAGPAGSARARAARQAAQRAWCRRARGARAGRSPGRSGARAGSEQVEEPEQPGLGHPQRRSRARRRGSRPRARALRPFPIPPGRDSRAPHLLASNPSGRCHENHQCRSPLPPPARDQGAHRQLAGRAADPHHHRRRDHRLGRGRRLPVGGQGDRRGAHVAHDRHRPAPRS